jgi:hypothetical protein
MLMVTSQHHSAVAAQFRWSEYGHWVGLASKALDGVINDGNLHSMQAKS